jgi:hypothetical protein
MSNSDGGSKLSGALIDNGGAEILVASGAEVWGIRDAEGSHTAVGCQHPSAYRPYGILAQSVLLLSPSQFRALDTSFALAKIYVTARVQRRPYWTSSNNPLRRSDVNPLPPPFGVFSLSFVTSGRVLVTTGAGEVFR